MKVITTISDLKQVIQAEKLQQRTIGFVPTMGYLHEGHRKLLKKAREENQIVVLSIFVNPLQFGPNEDLDAYPRDFEKDQKTAKEEGVDIVFYPSVSEMYPNELSVSVKVTKRTDVLCGESRPGHFDGVVTVVSKLFHLVQPNRAYFGKKDAQQLAVIEGLVNDLNFPLEIIPVDTVREPDGLAKSSRNVYLTEQERLEAPVLYKSLLMAVDMVKAGEVNPNNIVREIQEKIQMETTGQIDYVSMLTYPDLEPMEKVKGSYIIALAVKFSKARLIDNVILIEE